MKNARNSWIWISMISLLCSCSTSHQIDHGPSVNSAWKWSGHLGMNGALGTSSLALLAHAGKNHLQEAYDSTAVHLDSSSLHKDISALAGFAVDPMGMDVQGGLRLGLGSGLEIGYHYSGGSIYELSWQFLKSPQWQATLSPHYSSRKYELPSLLGKIQSLTQFELQRKDWTLPLIVGQNMKYGSIWGGPVLAYSKISYGFDPQGLFALLAEGRTERIPELIGQEKSHFGYGLNFGFKAGYKHVFILGSLSSYYQNFGSYELPGLDPARLSGLSFYPYLGLEIR